MNSNSLNMPSILNDMRRRCDWCAVFVAANEMVTRFKGTQRYVPCWTPLLFLLDKPPKFASAVYSFDRVSWTNGRRESHDLSREERSKAMQIAWHWISSQDNTSPLEPPVPVQTTLPSGCDKGEIWAEGFLEDGGIYEIP